MVDGILLSPSKPCRERPALSLIHTLEPYVTCIAAFINKNKTITMGGDSAATGGGGRTLRKDPKVFIKNRMIFGFCGSYRMGQLIQYQLKVPDQPKKMDDMEYMVKEFIEALRKCLKDGGFTTIEDSVEEGGVFLVGYNGRLYRIDSDFQVGESMDGYEAVGSGEDLALGSLHTTSLLTMNARRRIRMALEAAAYFNVGVAAPFNILELRTTK
jgi:ATP-dependent protease HslVU (ClpYQ) peptidase subunit